ncbi:HAMP domain-containing histidine kinase [Methylobacterium sp. C25]|uniref:sensor histidine kinase n=1 Tax=Methylobacterium sp. C25 TaxID=2721622 RepID=UPI001F4921D2|nr:HAMP domain-containing sensor histidine kinase [Methylobacterium sp. C25]MCE4223580.1 HAMP domain-containing histidine kinase [Methylobacterium sp. C25]
MRSLKVRFALLLLGTALLVMLAAASVLWSTTLSERTIDRVLAAQHRLELLAELSGRLTQYGLAAVETLGNPDTPPEALSITREAVDKALNTVEAAIGGGLAASEDRVEQIQYMARTRPLMKLRSARVILDRQVYQIQREIDPDKRKDSIQGALNAFGAMTGQPLSLLIESERRAMTAGSDEARTVSQRMRTLSLIGLAIALGLVLVLYRSVTRPTLARIEAVRLAAGAVGSGALDTRLSVATRDELGLLVANFNRMAARLGRRERHVAADRAALEDTIEARTADLRAANERLEMVDRSRRRFFADVSHELRTPLTVILGECDLASRSAGRTVDYGPVFATIRKRAQGLKRRVEDLLRVARSESGQIELDRRPVSALAVLTAAVEGAASEAAKRRVALSLEPGERDVELRADPEWLRQVVESLTDNALRHATGLTRIVIALAESRNAGGVQARITVTDDGPGFPEQGEDLFERFRRDAHSGEPGFGIGLALARWVIERHDGIISLGAGVDGCGARVTIELPAADMAAADHGRERVRTGVA